MMQLFSFFTVHVLSTLSLLTTCLLGHEEPEAVSSDLPPSISDVLADSPRFVVKLPDNNLLCFAIDGFELFTYNLITSPYLVVNGFLDLVEYSHGDKPGPSKKKGFTEVGVIINSIDRRMKGGHRLFKHKASGPKMKAFLEKFGEVDIRHGAVSFALDQEGHSSIENEQAKHETFQVMLDKPKVVVKAVSGDAHTFNVYVTNTSGLVSSGCHGLVGRSNLKSVKCQSQQLICQSILLQVNSCPLRFVSTQLQAS